MEESTNAAPEKSTTTGTRSSIAAASCPRSSGAVLRSCSPLNEITATPGSARSDATSPGPTSPGPMRREYPGRRGSQTPPNAGGRACAHRGRHLWCRSRIHGRAQPGGSVRSEVETTRLLPSRSGVGPERRLATQHAAVSALAESTSFADAVPKLLEAVGNGLGWDFGALWMPNGHGRTLRCVQTWSSPKIDARQFVDACSELELKPGDALPGKVWDEGGPVWVTDITRDGSLVRAPSAERASLRTGFA